MNEYKIDRFFHQNVEIGDILYNVGFSDGKGGMKYVDLIAIRAEGCFLFCVEV